MLLFTLTLYHLLSPTQRYFNARLHKTADLAPGKPYIFAYHPHGVLSFGGETAGWKAPPWQGLAPQAWRQRAGCGRPAHPPDRHTPGVGIHLLRGRTACRLAHLCDGCAGLLEALPGSGCEGEAP